MPYGIQRSPWLTRVVPYGAPARYSEYRAEGAESSFLVLPCLKDWWKFDGRPEKVRFLASTTRFKDAVPVWALSNGDHEFNSFVQVNNKGIPVEVMCTDEMRDWVNDAFGFWALNNCLWFGIEYKLKEDL